MSKSESLNIPGKGVVPVIPFKSRDVDNCDTSLVAAAIQIADECSNKAITAQVKQGGEESQKQQKINDITEKDWFVIGLIRMIRTMTDPKLSNNLDNTITTSTKTTDPRKALGSYFKTIWEAIPEGDRNFIKHAGEMTGVGDIVSIVKDIAKLGKAVAGLGDKEKGKESATQNVETQKKIKNIVEKLGFDPVRILTHPKYQLIKSKLDI